MDKAAFLSKRANECTQTVPLPSGGAVTIRALTIDQVTACKKQEHNEAAMLAACMVEPAITYEEAVVWKSQAPLADYLAITDAALEMSGANKEAPKSGVRKPPKRRR